MSHASEEDWALYGLFREALRSGWDAAGARAFAMGRERRSVAAFDEAVGRVEAELLALPAAGKVRRSFTSLGFSEAAARAESIDWVWSSIEEARRGTPAASSSALPPHERERVSALTEVWRRRWVEGDERLRESMRSEWGFDGTRFADDVYALELAEAKVRGGSAVVARRKKPKSSSTSTESRPAVPVELREVEGDDARLQEAFQRMGLSESAARDAAGGR